MLLRMLSIVCPSIFTYALLFICRYKKYVDFIQHLSFIYLYLLIYAFRVLLLDRNTI